MAKQSQDREDLLREGTAMPKRGRLMIEGKEIVIGIRRGGQFSLYWDQDPVFQFNTENQLRRVFIDGRKLKAESGKLLCLSSNSATNTDSATRVTLAGEWIGQREQEQILQRLSGHMQTVIELLDSAATDQIECVGCSAEAFRQRVLDWAQTFPRQICIAQSPAA